jgi:hypothetical protein
MFKRIVSLKYVIIVAFIIAVSFYVYDKDQKVRDQYVQQCQQRNAGINSKSSTIEDCDKGAESAIRHLPLLYRVFEWPEGITTLAILLTLLAIAEQTKETRRATEAALKQSNHMIASERAWLVMTSISKESNGAMPMYWWRIKNVGLTPAKIIETQAVCRIDMAFSEFPEQPEYSRPIELNDRLLAPGDSMDFCTFWSDTTGGIHKNESLESPGMEIITYHLVGYGYVKYRTVLDSDVHESRFCDDCIYTAGPADVERFVSKRYLEAPISYSMST